MLAAPTLSVSHHFGIYSGAKLTPTEADVSALLSWGAVIRGEFRWKKVGKTNWKAEVYLDETYDGARVKLVGTYNSRIRNLSYTLVWALCRIRSLDMNGPAHENPDGIRIETPHKHRWSNSDRDQWVYKPDDITETTVRGVFEQFLQESNIRFDGTFFEPVEQEELPL